MIYDVGEILKIRITDVVLDCPGEGSGDTDCNCDGVDGS